MGGWPRPGPLGTGPGESAAPAPGAGQAGGTSISSAETNTTLTGTLDTFVAFDWGEEIHLDRARTLVPAEVHTFPRRRRTPTSFAYRPPPLRFVMGEVALDVPEVGAVKGRPEVTVFDFGGVSVGLEVPFRLAAPALTRLAGWLAEPSPLVQAARLALAPLYRQLLPAIQKPSWQEGLSEEYFVFQLAPEQLPGAASLPAEQATWLAGLLRLEAGPLSEQEVAEALRLSVSYSPDDLFLPDWAAAVLIDRDCEETLQVIEFANLQLLEFRHIDNRLDDSLEGTYREVGALARRWLPYWRTHSRRLLALGELKVAAAEVFERTGNALKLVGDQYLARIYRQLSRRFHLGNWEESIRRKLEVIEGVYQALSDQAATYRAELLEVIIVGLILFEIVMTFVRP